MGSCQCEGLVGNREVDGQFSRVDGHHLACLTRQFVVYNGPFEIDRQGAVSTESNNVQDPRIAGSGQTQGSAVGAAQFKPVRGRDINRGNDEERLRGIPLKLEPRERRGICDELQTCGSEGFKTEQSVRECQQELSVRILRKLASDLLLRFDNQHIHPAAGGMPRGFLWLLVGFVWFPLKAALDSTQR